jgi:hypothetical protein
MVSADAYVEAINGIVNLLDPHRVGQRCGLTTPSVAAKYKPPRSPVGMSSHVVGLSFGFPESCREGEEGRSERGGPVPYEAMDQGGRALAQLAMPHGSSPPMAPLPTPSVRAGERPFSHASLACAS